MKQELIARVHLESTEAEFFVKLKKARQRLIPIQRLFEELLKQADLDYWEVKLKQ